MNSRKSLERMQTCVLAADHSKPTRLSRQRLGPSDHAVEKRLLPSSACKCPGTHRYWPFGDSGHRFSQSVGGYRDGSGARASLDTRVLHMNIEFNIRCWNNSSTILLRDLLTSREAEIEQTYTWSMTFGYFTRVDEPALALNNASTSC